MDYEKILLTLFCLAIGTVFGVVGLLLLVDTLRFLRKAVRTKGRVVGYEEREGPIADGPGSMTYHYPNVEFENRQGQKQCVTMALGSDRKCYTEGSTVPILFNPECPCEAKIKSFSDLWLFPLGFIIGGLAGVGMVFGIWFCPP